MDSITYTPIGVIHSPVTSPENAPIQAVSAQEISADLEVSEEFAAGLQDIEGFSHLILVYVFHRSKGWSLTPVPFLDVCSHGVFATRVPKRPNAIGFSVVRLVSRDERILHLRNVDLIDETPILDIKPYVPRFDAFPEAKDGWFSGKLGDVGSARSDGRFLE